MDNDNYDAIWQMTDDCLSHLRGVRRLALSDGELDGDAGSSMEMVDVGITDAGFAHLQGIQNLTLATLNASITSAAFSHSRFWCGSP